MSLRFKNSAGLIASVPLRRLSWILVVFSLFAPLQSYAKIYYQEQCQQALLIYAYNTDPHTQVMNAVHCKDIQSANELNNALSEKGLSPTFLNSRDCSFISDRGLDQKYLNQNMEKIKETVTQVYVNLKGQKLNGREKILQLTATPTTTFYFLKLEAKKTEVTTVRQIKKFRDRLMLTRAFAQEKFNIQAEDALKEIRNESTDCPQ